jgi:superfamily II DNA or RNA helicase
MIKELVNDYDRNKLICSKIAQDLKIHNENIVIVSDRKEHCKTIQNMLLNEYKIKSSVLVGGQSNKKEKKILVDSVKAGDCKVLISTIKFLGEGFDSKDLVALFITTPIKFVGKLIQAAGRILRYKEGKTPRIYDFRDNQINVLRYMAYGRDKVYKKEWNR